MGQEYIEESNQVPVIDSYDVIVVGGGIGAVGAALAASRMGMRTLIIEKSVVLGGLATLGFIAYYVPLCDGRGKKVTGGIPEELLKLSIKYGYNTLPAEWMDGKGVGASKRYETIFSPPEFIFAMDELMEAEKIDLLFDTVFSKPVMNEGRCEAIIVENKSGRVAYKASVFIDGTGDADLFHQAGADCLEEKNYLAYWYYNTSLEAMKRASETGDIQKGVKLKSNGMFRKDGSYNLGEKDYSPGSAVDVTRFVLDGRKLLKKQIEKNKEENGSLLALPGMAQFRRTRSVTGMYRLTEHDADKPFSDSIGVTGHWLKPGIVYDIPYRTLCNQKYENMLVVGRAISCEGDAWEATRVISAAVVTGQAAGTAAGIAISNKRAVSDISIDELQKQLRKDDVIISQADV